jgi:hypothetical protein
MPCYRCGARQVDPDRGESPWKRGVRADRQVLICPACQASVDWTSELDRCPVCSSVHLVRRLGEAECRDCGYVSEPGSAAVPGSAAIAGAASVAATPNVAGGAAEAPPGAGAEERAGGAGSAGSGAGTAGPGPGAGSGFGEAPGLAEEVELALERVLGRMGRPARIG